MIIVIKIFIFSIFSILLYTSIPALLTAIYDKRREIILKTEFNKFINHKIDSNTSLQNKNRCLKQTNLVPPINTRLLSGLKKVVVCHYKLRDIKLDDLIYLIKNPDLEKINMLLSIIENRPDPEIFLFNSELYNLGILLPMFLPIGVITMKIYKLRYNGGNK